MSASIDALVARAQSSRNRLANYLQKDQARMTHACVFGEVLAGAALAGVVDGRFAEPAVVGVPIVPVIGVLAAGTGLALGGKAGVHIMATGLGFMSGPVYAAVRNRVG